MVLYMSTKGQSISYDFFIASTIFLLIVLLIFQLFRYSNIQVSDFQKIRQISKTSDQLSEVWMRGGVPENWEPSNVVDLGLMTNSRLNQTKIDYLDDIGYEEVKRIGGLGFYDFYLRIYDSDNNTTFSFGIYPTDSEFVSKNQRLGILNSTIVFIDTLVWQ